MSEHFPDFDPDYTYANEQLAIATDKLSLATYADGSGPLTFSEIETVSGDVSASVQACAEEYGWPDSTDAIIEPVSKYASNDQFIESLITADSDGPRHIMAAKFTWFLNQTPIKSLAEAKTGLSIMGAHPVVHRARAVAPELFDNLRIVLQTLDRRYGIIADVDNVYVELMQDRNKHVVQAMSMAYQIMGRLLKTDDIERLNDKISFDSASSHTILNADNELRHNN